jgi:hypothetical protein
LKVLPNVYILKDYRLVAKSNFILGHKHILRVAGFLTCVQRPLGRCAITMDFLNVVVWSHSELLRCVDLPKKNSAQFFLLLRYVLMIELCTDLFRLFEDDQK